MDTEPDEIFDGGTLAGSTDDDDPWSDPVGVSWGALLNPPMWPAQGSVWVVREEYSDAQVCFTSRALADSFRSVQPDGNGDWYVEERPVYAQLPSLRRWTTYVTLGPDGLKFGTTWSPDPGTRQPIPVVRYAAGARPSWEVTHIADTAEAARVLVPYTMARWFEQNGPVRSQSRQVTTVEEVVRWSPTDGFQRTVVERPGNSDAGLDTNGQQETQMPEVSGSGDGTAQLFG